MVAVASLKLFNGGKYYESQESISIIKKCNEHQSIYLIKKITIIENLFFMKKEAIKQYLPPLNLMFYFFL